jgi:hypothetical protein
MRFKNILRAQVPLIRSRASAELGTKFSLSLNFAGDFISVHLLGVINEGKRLLTGNGISNAFYPQTMGR